MLITFYSRNLGPREGRGIIINVASMYGLSGPPGNVAASPYTASKHGVMGLTKSDATIYAPHNIRINAICPGYVDTPLLSASAASGAMDSEIAKTPMGRMGYVDEIADCIVFLGSRMSSFMCGSGLVVDGGYLAN
jgi:NAD(P)-dependent dehydrogenase (short-subunit alcohol dehydrogenase family)